MSPRIAIIGAGNMGLALARGLQRVFPPATLAICDRHAEKLHESGIARTSVHPDEVLQDADVVIIAVKPQSWRSCRADITTALSDKLLVSLMAGVTLEILRQGTGAARVVRAMPNLPVQVGRGVTGWIATHETTSNDRSLVHRMFESVGLSLELEQETMIDDISAVSGCGPAYVFLLCELLEAKAREMGFAPADARRITEQILIGSAKLLGEGGRSAAEWRNAVTSKGGVTEAAMQVLEEKGFAEVFFSALDAARERSRTLGS